MFIYLHVPFCLSRCVYCDFYVVLDKYGGHEAYVDAVCREIDLRFASINPLDFPQGIQTLYVGGGTPSLLDSAAYRRIFQKLNQYLPFASDAEITLEANPGAQRSEMADHPEAYWACGFNRISVGVQTLNNAELKKLSRLHAAEEAETFIQGLQAAGWRNISLDLMYGIPLQTEASWQETLRRAIALNVQHISMYGLKVEENTPLETLTTLPMAKGSYPLPEEEAIVAMYFSGLSTLAQAGFRRYEFSNLAQPGFESRHNLNYWNNGDFLALGVAAHGYWQGQRYETISDIKQYLNNPLAGTVQDCPPAEQLENAIIFGLRKAEGIDIAALEQTFGIDFRQRYADILDRYTGTALILNGHQLRLKESAIPLSNTLLAEFLGDA
ncbi:radical SAM family heme chaperone HemW [Vampirovibrio chlorellavorus]|uniref:radical SAM family heme chaperone HemW n=1 Tax=Vampirovibrio chlorellavorus TaxID=758823 RepID=UPI0026F2F231|nr:radical SAM family heme chaperone HemW [Vampirovibrio chlorellavorus]